MKWCIESHLFFDFAVNYSESQKIGFKHKGFSKCSDDRICRQAQAMGKKLPPGLRISPQGYRPAYGKHVRPDQIGLEKNPDIINKVPTGTRGRGIRNTTFRLPYLSNLRKMDPVFDDPY